MLSSGASLFIAILIRGYWPLGCKAADHLNWRNKCPRGSGKTLGSPRRETKQTSATFDPFPLSAEKGHLPTAFINGSTNEISHAVTGYSASFPTTETNLHFIHSICLPLAGFVC